MQLKKMVLLLMTVILVAIAFAGCSSKTETQKTSSSTVPATPAAASSAPAPASTIDTSKEVKLKMVLLGDGAPDANAVYDEINKKLKKDINATVEVQFLSWADWQKKYPLLFATGDDFDLVISATWSQFGDYARKGAFYNITPEILAKYAPQTSKNSSKEVLDAGTVDGKLYALPMNYHEITINGYVVRGDLMKKYSIPDIKTLDDFGTYLNAVSKNEKGMVPWEATAYDNWIITKSELVDKRERYEPGNIGLTVDLNDPKHKLIDDVANPDPDAVQLWKKMFDWNQKGYISKNALVNKVTSKDSFLSGKSAAFLTNLLEANASYLTVKANHPDWDVRFYPINTDKKVVANSFMANGMAVNAKSKNPERALMLLDLLKNDEWYNQTTTYGIKGKHWDLSPDKKIISLPDSKNYPTDAACPWGWRDERYYLSSQDGLPNFDAILSSFRSRVFNTLMNNFAPSLEKTKPQQAALQEVANQYQLPMTLGFSKNGVDKDYQLWLDKKKAAGQEELIADIQKQLDAFMKK